MKKPFTHVFFAIALCLLSINSYAQNGTLDATFNSYGTGANYSVSAMAIKSDGKILIGGSFTSYNGTSKKYIARLNTDGTLDTTFNPTGAGFSVKTMALQSDGKILIGGVFPGTTNHIARLNTDGSLDTTFNPNGTGVNGSVYAIAIQSDGKILIGGAFTKYNGTAKNYINRLNTDGTLDATFNPNGTGAGWGDFVSTIALQSDGKILIGGDFESYNGTGQWFIARLNTDGSLDAGFTGMGTNEAVTTIAVQSDGKILIGGSFTSYNPGPSPYSGIDKFHIARLNTDGSLDASFTGTGANGNIVKIAIQSDGKILIGGNFTSYNGTTKNHIARLNTDGTLDAGFTGSGTDHQVLTIVLQSDGKILISGPFTIYNHVTQKGLARINNTSGTGIANNMDKDATALSVFPNPSNGAVTIQLNEEETFSLYNCLGQIVRTIQLNQATGNSATITGLEPGLYFLTGQSNTLLNYKIIVE